MHSDLNPKNLLLDPDTLAITGVLDWEFAHAGHPFTDLGNVLRFDRAPAYVDAVLGAYAELRGTPPERALSWPGPPTSTRSPSSRHGQAEPGRQPRRRAPRCDRGPG